MTSDQKYRMTHQRQVILEETNKDQTHPTADEIYERVRKKLPRISMGTVYRNLEILSSCGIIHRLEPGLPQMRFDCNTRDHYHITCVQCGKIEDAPIGTSDNALENLPDDWKCPICGAGKKMFRPLAGPGSVADESKQG